MGSDSRGHLGGFKPIWRLTGTVQNQGEGFALVFDVGYQVQPVALKSADERSSEMPVDVPDAFAGLLQEEEGDAAIGHAVLPISVYARLCEGAE